MGWPRFAVSRAEQMHAISVDKSAKYLGRLEKRESGLFRSDHRFGQRYERFSLCLL